MIRLDRGRAAQVEQVAPPLVDGADFAAWLAAAAHDVSDEGRLSGRAQVGGPRTVVATAGSVVSAADGAVVLALPGSHVVAWAGARVYAGAGARIVLGAGGGAWIEGDSEVLADGETGLESTTIPGRDNDDLVVVAWDARLDVGFCQVYATDCRVTVRFGVTMADLGGCTVEYVEARASSVGRASASRPELSVWLAENAAAQTRARGRTVWSAYPQPGQTREEWLAPLVGRHRSRRGPLARSLRVGRLAARYALPPTIDEHDLRL